MSTTTHMYTTPLGHADDDRTGVASRRAAVGTQHLMLAATLQKDDVQAALQNVGVSQDAVRTKLREGKGTPAGLDRLFAATSKDELLPFGKDNVQYGLGLALSYFIRL